MNTSTTTDAYWGQVFNDIDPYLWAYMGTGLALSFSIVGAAWYLILSFLLGVFSSLALPLSAQVWSSQESSLRIWSGIISRSQPCSVIFCEAVAIYGVIMAIILLGKINYPENWDKFVQTEANRNTTAYYEAQFSGYCIFMSGLSVGLSNLFCG